MGTFRYTVGGSYNSTNDKQGFYTLSPVGSVPTPNGFIDVKEVEFTQVENTIGLTEYNADQDINAFTDSTGKLLDFNTTGYYLDYTTAQNEMEIIGGRRGDIINASRGADLVYGNFGDDELFGNGGDDHLIGGSGADILNGGEGNNTASYQGSSMGVIVNLRANTASNGDAQGDTFVNIQNLGGSNHSDILMGDANANVLRGGTGDDTLRGYGGADTLRGGDGNDRLVITQAMAGVIVHGGEGVDKLFLQGQDTFKFGSHDSFGGIERVYVSDGASLDLTGIEEGVTIVSRNAFTYGTGFKDITPTHITGTDAADRIVGGKGNDYINGGGGDDVLKGGSIVGIVNVFSELHGGDGKDTLRGIGGNMNLYGDAGSDTLKAGISDPNSLVLSSRLDGGTGGDKLFGNDGRDVFVFQKEFGRDNVYKFTSGQDFFDVSGVASSAEDVRIDILENGNSVVTFAGVELSNKIIVHDSIALKDLLFKPIPPHNGIDLI
ncbi:calcium-binding protein [Methylobacterium sp. CM6241]